MITLLSVLSLLALSTPAQASPYDYTVTLLGGPAALAGPPSYGGGVDGRLWLAGQRGAIEVGAREFYATGEARTVGAVVAGARVAIGEGPLFWRLAFAHNHETPIEVVLESPLASAAGTAEGIYHRTGAEVGLAWSSGITPALLEGSELGERLGINADLGIAGLTGAQSPHAYVYGGVHLTLGLGQAR